MKRTAEKAAPQEGAWLLKAHGNIQRPQGARSPQSKGQKAVDILNPIGSAGASALSGGNSASENRGFSAVLSFCRYYPCAPENQL